MITPKPAALEHSIASFTLVAPIASIEADVPRDFAVVTRAAMFPSTDGFHGNLVSAPLHLEKRGMAGVTFVSDAMDPMRKHRRRNPLLLALSFEGDVSLHGRRRCSSGSPGRRPGENKLVLRWACVAASGHDCQWR